MKIFFINCCILLFFNSYLCAYECNEYKRGYSTDYIRVLYKKTQQGDARYWKRNIKSSQVKKGDIAIFKNENYVGIVKSIIKDMNDRKKFVIVSSWNRGNKWVDYLCRVTNKFGKTNNRRVKIKDVDGGFWRP